MQLGRIRLAATLLLLCGPALASTGSAEADFTAATKLFERGDYEMALERFRSAHAAGMRTLAVVYNTGVCQYRTGRYEPAADTFRGIAAEYPEMRALAQYNLGLALLRLNRSAEARRAFEVSRANGDAQLAKLAETMLSRLTGEDSATAADRIDQRRYGYIDLGAGYDTNVALLEDSGIGTGETTDSSLIAFFGQLGGRPGLPGDPTVDASLYAVRYPDAGAFDQDVLRLDALWPIRGVQWRIDAGGHVSHSTLDGDGFERRLGVTVAASRQVGRNGRMEVRVVHDEIEGVDSRFAFVAGDQQTVDIRYLRQSGQQRVDLRYQFVVDDRASPEISASRHRIAGGYRRYIGDNWVVAASLSYRLSRFDELEQNRDETLGEATLSAGRDIGAGWRLSGEFRRSHNDSSVEGFGYERNRMTLSADRVFR